MGRSPSGKEQGVEVQGGSHDPPIVANRRLPVKDTPAEGGSTGPSTIVEVSKAVHRLGRTLLVLAAVAVLVALGRAALGRLAGDPGTSSVRGSFDAWPAVTPAPGRRAEDSGGVPDAAAPAGGGAPAKPS